MKSFPIQNPARIVILLGILTSQLLSARQPLETRGGKVPRQWLNVNYAGDEMTGHLLDIHLPEEGDPPFPVVITVAGSAFFSNNSKESAFELGKPLLKHGFAVVAANHRSSREAIFPAHVNDIKGVVRFLRAHASRYGLDTAFICITGNSSGGNLSAMIGTSHGVQNQTAGQTTVSIEGDVGGNAGESSRVDAVMDWYGPTAFEKMDSCGSQMVHDAPDSPESVYIGGLVQENLDRCTLANPITYADSTDPPFLIIHGDADPLVPCCQSAMLHQALQEKGVPCELIIVPGGGHGGPWEEKHKEKMASFFTEAKAKKKGE
ncbi:alpha/beta hydrolase [bacterium]|nr:alpha/beta hydrolase [bacterium]